MCRGCTGIAYYNTYICIQGPPIGHKQVATLAKFLFGPFLTVRNWCKSVVTAISCAKPSPFPTFLPVKQGYTLANFSKPPFQTINSNQHQGISNPTSRHQQRLIGGTEFSTNLKAENWLDVPLFFSLNCWKLHFWSFRSLFGLYCASTSVDLEFPGSFPCFPTAIKPSIQIPINPARIEIPSNPQVSAHIEQFVQTNESGNNPY